MIADLAARQGSIAALCARFNVRRLEVFGSAARLVDFGPESDVDILVTYDPARALPSFGDYLALKDRLTALFGRPVDLVVAGAIKNPYILASLERDLQVLHAA